MVARTDSGGPSPLNLEDLPPEIPLFKIFPLLDLKDRGALRSTSRALYFAYPTEDMREYQQEINSRLAQAPLAYTQLVQAWQAHAQAKDDLRQARADVQQADDGQNAGAALAALALATEVCEAAAQAEKQALRTRDRVCRDCVDICNGLAGDDPRVGSALLMLSFDPEHYRLLSKSQAADLVGGGLMHAWDAAPEALRQQLGDIDPVWKTFPDNLVMPHQGKVNWRGIAQALLKLDERNQARGPDAAPDAVSAWTDNVLRQMDQRFLLEGMRDQSTGVNVRSQRLRDLEHLRNSLAPGLLRVVRPDGRQPRFFHVDRDVAQPSCLHWEGLLRAPSPPGLLGNMLALVPAQDLPQAIECVYGRFTRLHHNFFRVADAVRGPAMVRDLRAQVERCAPQDQANAQEHVARIARAWGC